MRIVATIFALALSSPFAFATTYTCEGTNPALHLEVKTSSANSNLSGKLVFRGTEFSLYDLRGYTNSADESKGYIQDWYVTSTGGVDAFIAIVGKARGTFSIGLHDPVQSSLVGSAGFFSDDPMQYIRLTCQTSP